MATNEKTRNPSPERSGRADLRVQAEAQLQKRPADRAKISAEEARRLLHELQVHQIELEMQNEELARARAEAEELLRQYTDLYDFAPVGYLTLTRDGTIRQVNLAGASLLGLARGELINRRLGVFVSVESRPAFSVFLEKVFSGGGSKEACEVALLKEGSDSLWAHLEAGAEDRQECRAVAVDITERKQAGEALRQRLAGLEALHRVSAALRAAQTRDEALPILLDETLAALDTDAGIIWLHDPGSGELRAVVARGWFQHAGETPIEPGDGVVGEVFAGGQMHVSAELARDPMVHQPAAGPIPEGWGGACLPIRTGGITVGALFVSVQLPRRIAPEQAKLLESLADMAGAALHRMSLHEATVRQLDQLQAMHRVDQAIAASMDLRMMLNILLGHVATQLKVDAADVLLLDPCTMTLEHAAGRGFRTRAAESAHIRLGESLAGRAALERRAVQADDPAQIQENPQVAALWADEGFAAYYGVPLIAKGQVKGVLEVFHRSPLVTGRNWVSFSETLADQAAIAIDNAQLFDHMQRSNVDLALAYDAATEGWSRALDLRDRETEGHTLRVTEMTIRLAKAVGVGADELVHIHRGALLHDIGKLGVPDVILRKPGPLTEDEWTLMRQHPQFSFDMLAPIAFLQPALDIPYCHHEKWDGTGYPRGLKGEQILPAARLFAVVDVWDALMSDRPYREAWPEEKVLEYIRSLAGTHFDPEAVELFLKVMNEDTQAAR
jgi:PAS domain S-box-containing protein